MKTTYFFICILICLNLFVLSVFSFSIDGNDSGVEWDGASVYKLVDGDSGCGVNFGIVKIKLDNDENYIYYCFHFSDPNLLVDDSDAGISLSVNNSDYFEINASESSVYENISLYSFESAIYIDDNNGATCEVRFGFKSGLPQNIVSSVRFIDSNGHYSNYYDFTVVNEGFTVKNTVVYPTADNTDPVYNSNAQNNPTVKSTKVKSTKEKTTKSSTSKKYSSTNKKTETTLPYFYIKTSPPYSYTGRVKTTVPNFEKDTTAKSLKPEKSQRPGATVYYYEKEVYISQVYVTQSIYVTDSVSDSHSYSTYKTEIENTVLTSVSSLNDTMKLSDGVKYKKVISGIALSAFAIIAVIGTYTAKNKSKK